MGEIAELLEREDYDALIKVARERVTSDRRTLADPELKTWIGKRWRNIFLTEAETDKRALAASNGRLSLPGVSDKRSPRQRLAERFLVGDDRADWRPEMPPAPEGPKKTTLLFCPGAINGLLPVMAFPHELTALAERGWPIVRADAHPLRGCDANVEDIVATMNEGVGMSPANVMIPEEERKPPGDVVMLGYSKGTPDAMTTVIRRPELAKRVRAIISWGGPVHGSWLADDVHDAVKDLDISLGRFDDSFKKLLTVLFPLIRLGEHVRRIDEYDLKGATRDLTTPVRGEFLEQHATMFDELDLPLFHVMGCTKITEVPLFQVQGALELAKRDPEHDMQVPVSQARFPVPLATDLSKIHAHHWDMTYGQFPRAARLTTPNLDHPFPRQAALAATVLTLTELGIMD